MSGSETIQVPVEGAELHVTRRGRGPVCIVPSNIGVVPYERQMPAALDDLLTMVFVDLRGGGLSTGEPSDLTFDVLARDLEAVRAAVGADRVLVLGHSIVSVLAMEYGRRCPGTVSHVIGVGAPPSGDMKAIVAAGTAYFDQHASDERKAILRDNLAQLPAGTPPAKALFAQTPMRFHDPRFDAMPLFAGAISKPSMIVHLLGKLTAGWEASAVGVPTLLVHGRHDYVVPWTLWEPILPKLPGTTFELFDRSGHQPFVEEPERFVDVLRRWLGR